LRYTARARPHIWQRLRSLVENLGFVFAFDILDALAIRICLDIIYEFGCLAPIGPGLLSAVCFLPSAFGLGLMPRPFCLSFHLP
jgi:hypothetical protein